MKRIVFGILAATLALLVIVVPALAAYWAYLVIEETSGTSYSNLPVIALRNITQLANYGIITSTGLDTRVLTGDGEVLPHMLADDRVCVVTDLAASEKKQLVFYTGATSLSSFKIIVGHSGNITTDDVDELEMGYVTEVIASGHFDSSSGSDKNVLYKEDAFRMWISAANTLRVAALNSTGDEQWEMHYGNFTTEYHTIYVLCNGLAAYLYVDAFDIAKDTANLVTASYVQVTASAISDVLPNRKLTVYSNGVYWVLGRIGSGMYYWTSLDGKVWDAGTSIPMVGGYHSDLGIWEHDDYVHVAYLDTGGGSYASLLCYRRGCLNSNRTITWTANWSQLSPTDVHWSFGGYTFDSGRTCIGTDSDGYPVIMGTSVGSHSLFVIKSSNKDTWVMAPGYSQIWSSGPIIPGGQNTVIEYPNYTSNKMFATWAYAATNYAELAGRYCYSGTWGSVETIVPYSASYDVAYVSTVADEDDNVYVVWKQSDSKIYLRVRYSDGTWGFSTLLSSSGDYPSVIYNNYTQKVYIVYQTGGAVVGRAIVGDEIGAECLIYITTGAMTSMAYSEQHIGILKGNYYLLMEFAYVWNDNNEDWYWMQNNVMPYADLLEIAVDGTIHLKYEPADIIHGSTMPDSSNATGNDGTINWGENPPGVSAYLTPIESDEGTPPVIAPVPGGTTPGDMVGPTGQPGQGQTLPTLPSNPLYPFLSPLATLSGIPLGIMWILFATFLVVVAMLLTYKYVPHLFITVLVGCGLTAFFYHMGIYPFWVVIIFAIGGFAVIISERMPSVD